MKKILTSFMLLFVAVVTMAQQEARVVELSMKSQFFNFERHMLVYTPVGFDKYTATEYDVIYVFDAQERGKFDLVHCLMELSDTYQSNDRGKEFIIVGIVALHILQGLLSADVGSTTTSYNTFLDGSTGSAKSIVNTILLLLHLNLRVSTYVEYCYATSQLSQTLLQFLLIV